MNNVSKKLLTLKGKHSIYTVFEDYLYITACSLSNAVDVTNYRKREDKYLEIINKYTRDEVQVFVEAFAELAMLLNNKFTDVLGDTFMELELGDKYKGQFFTPYHISKLMAEMTMGDTLKDTIDKHGYVSCLEPCCGAGGMAIAMAEVVKTKNYSLKNNIIITAVDIDIKCTLMTYIQLSLLGIPAIVYNGDTLLNKMYDTWYTPDFILGNWSSKLNKVMV